MSWTIPRSFNVMRRDNPNDWQILFTEADFDPLGTISLNILISRAKKEIDGKVKYPAVFPIFANLYRIGLVWTSDVEHSLPAADNLQRVLTFPVQGTTGGYFLDRIPFNSQTQQYEPDLNQLFFEIRPGHFQWREGELGDLYRNQIQFRDLDVVTTNPAVKRAIGVKLLLKRKGYRYERTLKTEIEANGTETKVKRSAVFVPYYNLDDEVQDIDISASLWIAQ